MLNKISIISGGFDPVHVGHIALIKEASCGARGVIIALNSDDWLTRKKGKPFITWSERCTILQSIRGVLEVVKFDDLDGTACDALRTIREEYPQAILTFCNGGDRTLGNTPEQDLAESLGIRCKFGVGGEDKIQSSSSLLWRWNKK